MFLQLLYDVVTYSFQLGVQLDMDKIFSLDKKQIQLFTLHTMSKRDEYGFLAEAKEAEKIVG